VIRRGGRTVMLYFSASWEESGTIPKVSAVTIRVQRTCGAGKEGVVPVSVATSTILSIIQRSKWWEYFLPVLLRYPTYSSSNQYHIIKSTWNLKKYHAIATQNPIQEKTFCQFG
jgi:hypothetical protein